MSKALFFKHYPVLLDFIENGEDLQETKTLSVLYASFCTIIKIQVWHQRRSSVIHTSKIWFPIVDLGSGAILI